MVFFVVVVFFHFHINFAFLFFHIRPLFCHYCNFIQVLICSSHFNAVYVYYAFHRKNWGSERNMKTATGGAVTFPEYLFVRGGVRRIKREKWWKNQWERGQRGTSFCKYSVEIKGIEERGGVEWVGGKLRESGGTIRWEFPVLVKERAFVVTWRARAVSRLRLNWNLLFRTHSYAYMFIVRHRFVSEKDAGSIKMRRKGGEDMRECRRRYNQVTFLKHLLTLRLNWH